MPLFIVLLLGLAPEADPEKNLCAIDLLRKCLRINWYWGEMGKKDRKGRKPSKDATLGQTPRRIIPA